MIRERIFHYITIDRLDDWLALGWLAVPQNAPMHHNFYGLIVEWRCDCKMVKPR